MKAFPLKNIRAKIIAETVVDQILSRYGASSEEYTDQGRNFNLWVFRELSYFLEIKKTTTTPFHLQSNDLVERQHQINNYLAIFVAKNQRDWNKWIDMSLLAYRHETGIFLAELCFDRDLKLLLDLLCDSLPEEEVFKKFVGRELRFKIEMKIHDGVRQRLNIKFLRAKTFYDRKTRQIHFEPEQKVWLYNPRRTVRRTPKLQSN